MAKILLNKNNLFYNLDTISKKTGDKNRVAIVLKDNAYGHGLLEIANLAKEYGIKKAVVRTLEEAIKIEKLFDEILILSQKEFHTYSHTFHIALNSSKDIEHLPKNSNVHIKVNSGMHRNGINKESLEETILRLIDKKITISGIFTHHKSADKLSTDFFVQKTNFREIKEETVKICEKLNLDLPLFHSSNSSALFRDRNFDDDFARVGIATYGYIDDDNIFNYPKLKPVLSLVAKKMSSRILRKNQRVGYGGVYQAKEDIKISTYDIGYADGFFRLNERKKFTTPDGYNILGRVSMDSLALNCTDDEICIFNDAKPLAKIHDTISYEILTALKSNIPRYIV